MKKIVSVLICLVLILTLIGCRDVNFTVSITVPANSTAEYVFSDEEISPLKRKIKITANEGFTGTSFILKTVEVNEENAYEPFYLQKGSPVELNVEKGAWYKIGIAMQNCTDEEITVTLDIENANVRIS